MLVAAFAFQGAFDLILSRIVSRASALFDPASQQERTCFDHSFCQSKSRRRRGPAAGQRPRSDPAVSNQRGSDRHRRVAWTPIFLIVCFLIHPAIGLFSLVSIFLFLVMTIMTEASSRGPAQVVAFAQSTEPGCCTASGQIRAAVSITMAKTSSTKSASDPAQFAT
jgi:ATP-binding cassette subfamily C protein PrsD